MNTERLEQIRKSLEERPTNEMMANYMAILREGTGDLLGYIKTLERMIGDAHDESAAARQAFVTGQLEMRKRIEDFLATDDSNTRSEAIAVISRMAPKEFDLEKCRRAAGSYRILSDLIPGMDVTVNHAKEYRQAINGKWLEDYNGQTARVVVVYVARKKLDDYETEELKVALRLADGHVVEVDVQDFLLI